MHKFLFYIKFIIFLYMFRALLCSSLGGQIVLYSIWYRHTCRWQSGALSWSIAKIILRCTVSKTSKLIYFQPFKCRVKSHLPFPGIIRSSPYSPL